MNGKNLCSMPRLFPTSTRRKLEKKKEKRKAKLFEKPSLTKKRT